jgi:hypothetical protein
MSGRMCREGQPDYASGVTEGVRGNARDRLEVRFVHPAAQNHLWGRSNMPVILIVPRALWRIRTASDARANACAIPVCADIAHAAGPLAARYLSADARLAAKESLI